MLEAVHTDLVFTISLKRSTQNLQLSTAAGRLPHLMTALLTPCVGTPRKRDAVTVLLPFGVTTRGVAFRCVTACEVVFRCVTAREVAFRCVTAREVAFRCVTVRDVALG